MKIQERKCSECKLIFPIETMHCYDSTLYLCEGCQKKVDEYFEQNPSPEGRDE